MQQERMMRDKIVFTTTCKPQELSLREDNLTLDRAIQICRAYEHSTMHVKELNENITASIKANKLSVYKKQKHFQNLKTAQKQKNKNDSEHGSKGKGSAISVVINMSSWNPTIQHVERDATNAMKGITLDPNVRKYMP
jgi:predicted DNA binding protein